MVESGEKNGRNLGFPTANLHLGELIHPKHGIYAVRARIDQQGDWRTPTTGIRDPLLETHIFDFKGDLYGKWLEVELISYIRPELKFPSLDALVEAMHADAAEARKRLSNLKK